MFQKLCNANRSQLNKPLCNRCVKQFTDSPATCLAERGVIAITMMLLLVAHRGMAISSDSFLWLRIELNQRGKCVWSIG